MGSSVLFYGRLVFFPIVVPLLVTYFHFQRQFQLKELIHVKTVSFGASSELAGVYRPSGSRLYKQQVKEWDSNPLVFLPDVTLLADHLNEFRVTERKLEYSTRTNTWCFVSSPGTPPFCQATLEGAWELPGTNGTAFSVYAPSDRIKGASSSSQSSKPWLFSFFGGNDSNSSFRRNPRRQARPHRNLEWLLDHPATALCLLFNIGAAFGYFYFKVPAASVALIYSRMLQAGEGWRVLTGGTAHYEVWHLGLNMMGLYGLGSKLEGRTFTSVAFFFYNLSMLPLTGAVWLMMQHGLRRLRRSATNADVPTVGYSGVLYAWLAVSALKDGKDDWLKSLGGMLFYTLVYSALPGISISGHLAGVVVGVALSAGMLPIQYVQPSVVVPVLYLAYCRYVRKLFQENGSDSPPSDSRCWTLGTDKSQEVYRRLLWCMAASCVASCAVFGPLSSMSLSSMTTLAFWYSGNKYSHNVSTQSTLLRGFVVSAVLSIITDAMTFGAWLAIDDAGPMQLAVTFLRWSVHGAAICLSCHLLAQSEDRGNDAFEYKGIFNCTLGWTILLPAESLGKELIRRRNKRTAPSSPFGGHGRTLGGGRQAADIESSQGLATSSPLSGNGRRTGHEIELGEQSELSQLV